MFCCVYFGTLFVKAAKPLFQLILLAIFLNFFGLPAINTYLKKEVMVVEKKRDTDGIPLPAITIVALDQQKPEDCYSLNDGSIEKCIEENSLNSSDLLRDTLLLGMEKEATLNLSKDMFTEDSTQYWSGIYYTLNLSLTIGPASEEDQVDLFLSQKKLTYQIFLHDPGFFILSDNPIAFPMEARVFKTGGISSGHIYRLNLIQMNELNVPSDPCNEDPKFNFRTCVKGSIAEKVFFFIWMQFIKLLMFFKGWLFHQVGPSGSKFHQGGSNEQSTVHE